MKKNRIIAIFCMLLALLPAVALAETVEVNSIQYLLDGDNKTATVVSGDPINKHIIQIPDVITVGSTIYRITSIGEKAFYMKTYQELYIGSNIEKIESNAFGTSFDLIQKIQFNSSCCQSIANDAFDWMSFANGFQLIVCGTQGSMDTVLSGVTDLKGKAIIYQDTQSEEETATLQKQINDAPDGQETIISISKDYELTATLLIPSGKKIILTDDGTQRMLSPSIAKDSGEMFKVEAGASLKFDGNLMFKGGKSQKADQGNIVNAFGEFTLQQGKLCDGSITGIRSAAVLVNQNAKFTMTGGSIEGFRMHGSVLSAAVVVGPDGFFNMTGGTIQNNTNESESSDSSSVCGGGVLLYTWYLNEKAARMQMSDKAAILGNKAPNGGGIYLIGNTDITMSGGFIRGNKATSGYGGGICVAGSVPDNKDQDITSFIMEGGVIEQNSANASGGGIYINSQYVTLKRGRIQNNHAGTHGGGIYVSKPPYKVRLYNAVVTENKAQEAGGGLWFCPAGNAEIHVTNGAAIYGNEAGSAGDDFVSVGNGSGSVMLAERMLGGGKANWYQDGAVRRVMGSQELEWMEVGEVDPSVPRFSVSNPGSPQHGIITNKGCSLKSILENGSIQLAQMQGQLFITGNDAYTGGGIGANGGIVIGEEDEYELQVSKEWDSATPETKKCDVTIQMVIEGIKQDVVVLNQDNQWKASFTGLPKPAALTDYTVIEVPVPAGFSPQISDLQDAGNHIYQIHVKNQIVDIPTPTPTRMPTPTPMILPDDVPKTGDDSNITLWVAMMLIAGGSLIALITARKAIKK